MSLGRIAALAVLCAAPLPAAADPLTLDGVTFSDERGGVVLVRGRGSGRLDDPFVLIEEITDTGPAVIVIRGLTAEFGNRIGSHHVTGFALTKVVRNGTAKPWPSFELELREVMSRESPYEDGLSFGQGTEAGKPFFSDVYREARETQEPLDGVSFTDGRVGPGETVTVSFIVTEMTPEAAFFLIQKREEPIAGAPPAEAPPLAAAARRGAVAQAVASSQVASQKRAGSVVSVR